jgi:hypothetical protein
MDLNLAELAIRELNFLSGCPATLSGANLNLVLGWRQLLFVMALMKDKNEIERHARDIIDQTRRQITVASHYAPLDREEFINQANDIADAAREFIRRPGDQS